MTEKWRDIVGFGGNYQISSSGAVRSVDRLDSQGNRIRGKAIKPCRNTHGYLQAHLYSNGGRRFAKSIHRLVLEAFVGPCPHGMQACHGDGNRSNNVLVNLRWGTPASNYADRAAHGMNLRGERNPLSKLTMAQVRQVRQMLKTGMPQRAIGKAFGVHQSAIWLIAHNKNWREEPKQIKDL